MAGPERVQGSARPMGQAVAHVPNDFTYDKENRVAIKKINDGKNYYILKVPINNESELSKLSIYDKDRCRQYAKIGTAMKLGVTRPNAETRGKKTLDEIRFHQNREGQIKGVTKTYTGKSATYKKMQDFSGEKAKLFQKLNQIANRNIPQQMGSPKALAQQTPNQALPRQKQPQASPVKQQSPVQQHPSVQQPFGAQAQRESPDPEQPSSPVLERMREPSAGQPLQAGQPVHQQPSPVGQSPERAQLQGKAQAPDSPVQQQVVAAPEVTKGHLVKTPVDQLQENCINPFKITFENRSFEHQAKEIVAYFDEYFKLNPKGKIGITYSANCDQASDIYADYKTNKLPDIGGGGQALLFKAVLKQMEGKQWAKQVHILPIPTCLHSGGEEVSTMPDVKKAMDNIDQHLKEGYIVLGLQNQKSTTERPFAIGGAIAGGVWFGTEQQKFVDAKMKALLPQPAVQQQLSPVVHPPPGQPQAKVEPQEQQNQALPRQSILQNPQVTETFAFSPPNSPAPDLTATQRGAAFLSPSEPVQKLEATFVAQQQAAAGEGAPFKFNQLENLCKARGLKLEILDAAAQASANGSLLSAWHSISSSMPHWDKEVQAVIMEAYTVFLRDLTNTGDESIGLKELHVKLIKQHPENIEFAKKDLQNMILDLERNSGEKKSYDANLVSYLRIQYPELNNLKSEDFKPLALGLIEDERKLLNQCRLAAEKGIGMKFSAESPLLKKFPDLNTKKGSELLDFINSIMQTYPNYIQATKEIIMTDQDDIFLQQAQAFRETLDELGKVSQPQ